MDAVALQLVLGRARGLTAQLLRSAIEQTGAHASDIAALEALIGERPPALRALGLSSAVSAWLHAPDRSLIDADREWLTREHVLLIDALSNGYPPQLAQADAAPALLYVRGEVASLCLPQLAMVGSRHPTVPGRRNATQFAACLSRAGLSITSGLALGIDAASHEGALGVGGRTIAVLGTGLDQVYPPEHAALAERIAAQGALVSEFPRASAPLPANFPRRNRIISGLSLGTLVVEAARYSGSLITARLALEQGREVFAIPGSIHNPLTRGCHALIQAGAKLVESAQDIFDEIAISFDKQDDMSLTGSGDRVTAAAMTLDKGHKILLDALGFESASVDALVERTGLPSHSIASMLLILELEGAVGSQAGGRYVRL
ncbi:MAG TPA: DNA-processing protein DprA [Steroidobacteraceae bacterium]|jgi:DNA processing protein